MSAAPARLLLVDDNRDFLALCKGILVAAHPSAHIDTVETGLAALEYLGSHDVDVLLLDHLLPDIHGLEVLAEIRQRELDVAVIVATGAGDEQLVASLFRMGAWDYLIKSSFGAVRLRRAVESALERRHLERLIREQSNDLARTSREVQSKARALDEAYENLRDKSRQLQDLSDSLEIEVQRRTEAQRATSSFLNHVLDSTVDHFIVVAARSGEIMTFNRGAELAFGHRASEVVGALHYRELFVELQRDDEALAQLDNQVYSSGRCTRTFHAVDLRGEFFVAQVGISRLHAADEGDVAAFVFMGSDVTRERQLTEQNARYIEQIEQANEDLRRKNEEILAAHRLKGQFVANVSHELRTPLNAIIGYADLMQAGVYGPLQGKQVAAVGGISSRAADLLHLINGILDMARIEAGRLDLHLEEFQLGGVVDEVLDTVAVLVDDKAIQLSFAPDGEGLLLYSDRQKVSRVLLNLVHNAVKFTEAGFVRVEASPVDHGLEIRVVDSGIGIAAEDLEMIFDEFRQVDGTSTRRFGGTGLGLAITRGLVGELQGELWATSVPGEGSTFSVRLPRRHLGDA